MLVKFTDVKGKDLWINPLYVKAIAEGKHGVTDIYITYGSVWGQQSVLKVKLPADEVAFQISAAMPAAAAEMAAITVAQDEAQTGAASTGGAAGAAAVSG
ncbi:MAG: hypothetical protein AAFX05_06825 [Planctomycetota bacterium]